MVIVVTVRLVSWDTTLNGIVYLIRGLSNPRVINLLPSGMSFQATKMGDTNGIQYNVDVTGIVWWERGFSPSRNRGSMG